MHRFWLLLLTSESLSFLTSFHLDNLIAVKIIKAVSFTGETQINRAFHKRRTKNVLFAKSAFPFFIPKYRPMSCFVSSWVFTWGRCYNTPPLSFGNILLRFSLWWPTYRSINRLTLKEQSISNLTWKLQ